MTPTMAPPAGEGAPSSSRSDVLDSIDFGAPDSGEIEQPLAGDEGGEQPLEQTDPEATDNGEEDLFADEDADPEKFEDSDDYRVSPNRWKKHVAARKFATEVQQFAPSVEAAREHFERASDFRHMESDFRGADPANITAWMNHWGSQSPEAMGQVGSQILPWLANSGNPAAHAAIGQVESQVTRAMTSRLYDAARASGNPDDLLKAQNTDFYLNGSFKTAEQLKVQPQQRHQPQQSSDSAQLDRLISTQWQQLNQQQIIGAKESAMTGKLDSIFNRPDIKAGYTPQVLDALRSKIATEAEAKLATDVEWKRNHDIELRDIQREFTQAMRTGKPTNLQSRIDALKTDYAARLGRIIPQLAKPMLDRETKRVVSESDQRNRRLAAGAAKSQPAGGGRPTPRSLVDAKQYGSREELLNDVLG